MIDQRVRRSRRRESGHVRPPRLRNSGPVENADAVRSTIMRRYHEGESVVQLPEDDGVPSMGAAIRAQLADLE